MRASPLNLLLVLGVAALLRFWSLDHGIPYAIGVDEPEVVGRVVAMMKTGDFNPRFFDYPGFIFYLHLPFVVARFLLGAIAGQWTSLNAVGPSDFYLVARAVTAALGTLTILVLYHVGQRWGARHALLGAGLLAVMPMHVRESHYALTDVPATFFATLTLLLSLVAHEKATLRAFVWAGVAAGLTIGTKYNAGVVLIVPLIAAVMTLEAAPSRGKCLLAVLVGALGTFLLVAPYTLLDLPGFLNGFASLVGHYQPRSASEEPGWIVYLKHLRLSMGWPASLLLAVGLALGVVRAVKGPGRLRWTLLVALPVVYFAMIGGRVPHLRAISAAAPAVCLSPRGDCRRLGCEPAEALRHPASPTTRAHRCADGGRAPAAARRARSGSTGASRARPAHRRSPGNGLARTCRRVEDRHREVRLATAGQSLSGAARREVDRPAVRGLRAQAGTST